MYHEKTIKNSNGDKALIRVNFYISNDKPFYSIDLAMCMKGKRKFEFLRFDSYDYRALSMEKKQEYRQNEILKYATEEQINGVKMELWNLLKP